MRMFKLSMRTIFTPDISPPGVAIRKSTMSSADEREIGDQDGLAWAYEPPSVSPAVVQWCVVSSAWGDVGD